ncbi:MAG: hypothetical protein L3K26_06775 [Candidatus Hydrogenedentes bacterium]|nr:hypothetical protein [Candidatus Hydrogenedentota bacterium]
MRGTTQHEFVGFGPVVSIMIRCLLAVLLAVIAFPWSAAQAAEGSELKLWVVEATTEKREKPQYDKGLEAIERVLSALPHDTYRKVHTGKHTLLADGLTRIMITKTYTLETKPPVATSDGRLRLRLRILMKTTDKPPKEIEAVSTELLLQPDKQLVVRGLKQKGGKELVLVFALTVPPK